MSETVKKKRGSKSNKGGKFERDTCRQLSTWFSKTNRDDLFWRSAGSGGMATNRRFAGKQTANHVGDIAVADPEGAPLLELVSIELKRGYSKINFADSFDSLPQARVQPWEEFILQANRDATAAGAFSWWLIARRDRRETLVFMPFKLYRKFLEVGCLFSTPPCAKLHVSIKDSGEFRLFCTSLGNLLHSVERRHILKILKNLKNVRS